MSPLNKFQLRATMNMTQLNKALAGVLLLCAFSLPTYAGDGHDHGEAPAAASGAALPRFTAISETYELVGILNDRKLSLYLDRAADNSPAKDAKLELELGGKAVPVSSVGEGEFEATLDTKPESGEITITATVVAGNDSDLLASELAIHPENHAEDSKAGIPWKPLAGGAALLLAVAGFIRVKRARQLGGAA